MNLPHPTTAPDMTALTSAEDREAGYWFSLIPENEASHFCGVTARTLQSWRQRGGGPKFIKISARCIKYRRIDCRQWAEARMRRSTSDPGPDAQAA